MDLYTEMLKVNVIPCFVFVCSFVYIHRKVLSLIVTACSSVVSVVVESVVMATACDLFASDVPYLRSVQIIMIYLQSDLNRFTGDKW